jgi:hypothetical protein
MKFIFLMLYSSFVLGQVTELLKQIRKLILAKKT